MARQRTLVYMTIDWDDATTPDPRKWDWNALVNNGDGDETVTNIGTYRIAEQMTEDGVQELMDEITTIAGDVISDYHQE